MLSSLVTNPLLRALLGGLTALAVSLLVGAPVLGWLRRLNVREKTEKTPIEDERLVADISRKSGTPTMGGLILLAGLLAGTLLWADLTRPVVASALVCTLAMAALGATDDWLKLTGSRRTDRGLKARWKLVAQGCVGALLGLALFGRAGGLAFHLPWWALPLALAWGAFVLGTMANATNITDGMDGLLAGLALPAALALGVACATAGAPGAQELAVLCASVAGGCLGFLRLNRHPAQVFMGDTGSMAIGGALAAAALGSGRELVLALAGLVFLVEFGSSLLQIGFYKAFGRRILPIAPVHYIFQRQGHPEPRIVRGFYAAGLAAALAGVGSLAF